MLFQGCRDGMQAAAVPDRRLAVHGADHDRAVQIHAERIALGARRRRENRPAPIRAPATGGAKPGRQDALAADHAPIRGDRVREGVPRAVGDVAEQPQPAAGLPAERLRRGVIETVAGDDYARRVHRDRVAGNRIGSDFGRLSVARSRRRPWLPGRGRASTRRSPSRRPKRRSRCRRHCLQAEPFNATMPARAVHTNGSPAFGGPLEPDDDEPVDGDAEPGGGVKPGQAYRGSSCPSSPPSEMRPRRRARCR